MKLNLHLPKIVSLFALVLIQSLSGVASAVEIDHLLLEKAVKITIMNEEQIKIISDHYARLNFEVITKPSTILQKWLENQMLSTMRTFACYNSAKILKVNDPNYFINMESVGLLSKRSNSKKKSTDNYDVFGADSILFPLKNESQQIVNFCCINIENHKICYLNQEGIYPSYPKFKTSKLFIVPTILDAATLLETKLLKPSQSVIALFDGKLMPQHEQAIKRLKHLIEVIWLETTKI